MLTIPATRVQAEKNVLCSKRVKANLRNSLTQEYLSGLAIISIKKKLLGEHSKGPKFYDDTEDAFASMKKRRIDLLNLLNKRKFFRLQITVSVLLSSYRSLKENTIGSLLSVNS